MIKTLVLGKEVKEGALADLGKKRFVWVDCLNPTKDDLDVISERTRIPLEELNEVLDEEERPRITESDPHSIIIFKAPTVEKHEILTKSFSILLSSRWVVTLRRSEFASFEKLAELPDTAKKRLMDKGPGHLVYVLLDEILRVYFSMMDKVEEQIDSVEIRLFRKPERATARDIFALKKTLIYFHKALAANREVISSIEKEYLKQIPKKELRKYRTLYHDVTELLDLESTYRDILTGTLEIYLSSVSNNLNTIMKKLTALASFVLIPTLISGIYGMNFRHMPELAWTYGYWATLGLMVFSVVGLFVYFKKKEWL